MKSPEEDGGGKRGRGELAVGHGGSEGVAAGPLGCNLRLGGSRVQSPGGAELQQTDGETDITCWFGRRSVYGLRLGRGFCPNTNQLLGRGPSVVSEARRDAVSQDAPRCSSNDLTSDY